MECLSQTFLIVQCHPPLFSLFAESGGDLHIALPDGLCAAGAAVHRAVHPPAHHAHRVRPGRVQGHVGRRQGDATREWKSVDDLINYVLFFPPL